MFSSEIGQSLYTECAKSILIKNCIWKMSFSNCSVVHPVYIFSQNDRLALVTKRHRIHTVPL
jgi:hypothetical protein